MYVKIAPVSLLIIAASMLVFRYESFKETEQLWSSLPIGKKGEVLGADGAVTRDGLLLHSMLLAFIVVSVCWILCSQGWEGCKPQKGKKGALGIEPLDSAESPTPPSGALGMGHGPHHASALHMHDKSPFHETGLGSHH